MRKGWVGRLVEAVSDRQTRHIPFFLRLSVRSRLTLSLNPRSLGCHCTRLPLVVCLPLHSATRPPTPFGREHEEETSETSDRRRVRP